MFEYQPITMSPVAASAATAGSYVQHPVVGISWSSPDPPTA
jgi:hypothetical protein